MVKESRVTVKIPRPLYRRIQQVIENSGFSSPTDFIVFVLRDLLGEVASETGNGRAEASAAPAPTVNPTANPAETGRDAEREEFTAEELRSIQRKLRNLGYLD
ncbi:MAG: CopG family transcriptional regulator [Planctomycetota bacterium]|nr:MAG: CopG family transcriptional regulator [Planctomycetota bacterium]